MTDFKPFYPVPPAHVPRYVDVLGIESTIDLLLNFGGSEIYVPADPKGNGMLESVIGYEKAKRLAEAAFDMKHRVPLANKWLADCLYVQGLSVAGISRRLRVSDTTVRKYLHGSNAPRPAR